MKRNIFIIGIVFLVVIVFLIIFIRDSDTGELVLKGIEMKNVESFEVNDGAEVPIFPESKEYEKGNIVLDIGISPTSEISIYTSEHSTKAVIEWYNLQLDSRNWKKFYEEEAYMMEVWGTGEMMPDYIGGNDLLLVFFVSPPEFEEEFGIEEGKTVIYMVTDTAGLYRVMGEEGF